MKCIRCNSQIFILNDNDIKCDCILNSHLNPQIRFNNETIHMVTIQSEIFLYKIINWKICYLFRMKAPFTIKTLESTLNNLIFI